MNFKVLVCTLLLFLNVPASEAETQTASQDAHQLRPFTTDGCSSFPDGTPANPTLWRHCCVIHDVSYWQGGTRAQRRAADRELYQCVSQTGHDLTAVLMYSGVEVFGAARFPTTWRWGYGWKYIRAYEPLDESERAQVAELLPPSPLTLPIVKSNSPFEFHLDGQTDLRP